MGVLWNCNGKDVFFTEDSLAKKKKIYLTKSFNFLIFFFPVASRDYFNLGFSFLLLRVCNFELSTFIDFTSHSGVTQTCAISQPNAYQIYQFVAKGKHLKKKILKSSVSLFKTSFFKKKNLKKKKKSKIDL